MKQKRDFFFPFRRLSLDLLAWTSNAWSASSNRLPLTTSVAWLSTLHGTSKITCLVFVLFWSAASAWRGRASSRMLLVKYIICVVASGYNARCYLCVMESSWVYLFRGYCNLRMYFLSCSWEYITLWIVCCAWLEVNWLIWIKLITE